MCPSAFRRNDDAQFSDEVSVVAAARNGDSSAFGVLAANYRRKIFNTVRHITGNRDDAEDVTQQTLMQAFVNIRGFRGTCLFSTWLTRIAINEALMLRRRSQVRSEVARPISSSSFEEREIVPEVPDARPNPEQCYDKQERRQLVEAAIKGLKPASRIAIEICDLNDSSLKDLAAEQGISLAAAKARLFRSRNLLRAKVMRFLRVRADKRLRPSGLLV